MNSRNKSFLIIYVLAVSVHYFSYWQFISNFLVKDKNIYAFNWAGTISLLILIFACAARVKVTFYTSVLLHYLNIFPKWARKNLDTLKFTNYELKVRQILLYVFIYEFCFSAYLTIYSLYMGIPEDGSIGQTMRVNDHFLPFEYYYFGELLISILLSVVLLKGAIDDRSKPDNHDNGFTKDEKMTLVQEFKRKRTKKFRSGL